MDEIHGSGAQGHRRVALSLTTEQADGGSVHQSWDLCECSTAELQARLGPPDHEAVATAGQVREIAETVLDHSGPQL